MYNLRDLKKEVNKRERKEKKKRKKEKNRKKKKGYKKEGDFVETIDLALNLRHCGVLGIGLI